MYTKALTWWTFFQISINERLIYRGDFMLGTLMRFLPTLTQIFLWWAIYDVISTAGTADSSAGPDGTIAGYRYGDMVAYYLLVIISRAFSSMPGLTSGHRQPDPQWRGQTIPDPARRYAGLFVDAANCSQTGLLSDRHLPFALVFFLCRDFFVDGWPPADVMVVYLLSLMFSLSAGLFYLEVLHWLDRVLVSGSHFADVLFTC